MSGFSVDFMFAVVIVTVVINFTFAVSAIIYTIIRKPDEVSTYYVIIPTCVFSEI